MTDCFLPNFFIITNKSALTFLTPHPNCSEGRGTNNGKASDSSPENITYHSSRVIHGIVWPTQGSHEIAVNSFERVYTSHI